MKEVRILDINVTDFGGTKEPLIFLHSFPMTGEMWNRQIEFFKEKFRVIIYDLRGFGKSISKDNIITMEKLVNDFFHIINALKISKVHACGLSMGGYILMRALQKNSDRFRSVTLVNTKLTNDDNGILLKRSSSVIKIQSGGRQAFLDKLIPGLISIENRYNSGVLREINDIIALNSDAGICSGLIALSTRTDLSESGFNIQVPVLILSGTDDVINLKQDISVLYEYIRRNSLNNFILNYALSSCGHLCNLEKPDEFNLILQYFLNCIEND
ncbi:MAG: alpha/beta hydrolase [Ignavibacteria bacterium]|jgi:pimeloyl-ACP methyl ester carboxylesterase|nr:alpha/beta hydrolase [Ignavibacteria bacterium]